MITERLQSRRWVVPALCVLVLVSFGLSLAGGFVWDDRPLIVESGRIQDVARVGEIFTTGFWETGDSHDRFRSFFRPLVSASFAIDYALWGLRPFGFHLTNLLLHLGCTLLVLRLARLSGFGSGASFCGSALFAVHPVHVESVAWISGRTDLLATFFVLAAFVSYMRHRSMQSGSPWVACALFLTALLSKEAAAPFPAVVFVAAWVQSRPSLRWSSAVKASAPFFVVLGLYLAMRATVLGTEAAPIYSLEPVGWLATAVFVLARYLTLLLLPLGLDAHYPYAPIVTPIDARVAIGAAMLVATALGLRRLTRDDRTLLIWPAWIGLFLVPVLAFGRFGDVLMADRFLYLPSVGFCLLAAHAARFVAASEPGVAKRAAFGLALAVLAALTIARAGVWRSDERLFSDMLRTSPDSALVHNNLGSAFYHDAEIGRAIEHFERAVELVPDYALAHNNLAAGLHASGQLDEALKHYQEASRLAPGLIMAGANGGHLLVELGRRREGLSVLRRVVDTHSDAPAALFAYADALQLAGQPDEALRWLDRIREIDPGYTDAFYLRGKIHAEAGRLNLAAEEMKRFLARWTREDRRADRARAVIAYATAS